MFLFHTLCPGCILQYNHAYYSSIPLDDAWGGSMTWGRKEILGIFGIGEDMVQEVVSLFRGPSDHQLV